MEEEKNTKTIEQEVRDNYEFFKENRRSLSEKYSGKFVLIHDRRFIDFFDGEEDAIAAGRLKYENGLFSVQKISDDVIDLGFIGYGLEILIV